MEPATSDSGELERLLTTMYVRTIDNFMAAIILDYPQEVANIFNDMFNGSLGRFRYDFVYCQLAIAINQSVTKKLYDRGRYALVTDKPNAAGAKFNEIIQSCRKRLSER